MKLSKVRIRNFRCIRDSGEFALHPKVTALVGKNESGKTTVLEALARLNPADTATRNLDEIDLPRHLQSELMREHGLENIDCVDTSWQLEAGEVERLKELLPPKAKVPSTISLSLAYDGTRRYEYSNLSENLALARLAKDVGLPSKAQKDFEEAPEDQVWKLEQVRAIIGEEESESAKSFLDQVKTRIGKGAFQPIFDLIDEMCPNIGYFSEYTRLPSEVSIQALMKEQAENRVSPEHSVFLYLLDIAGVTPAQLIDETRYETHKSKLESTSNSLTRELMRHWSQNRDLEVEVDVGGGRKDDPAPFNSGTVVRIRVKNRRHGVTTPFSSRSAGFVWFLSFLVWFHGIKKKHGGGLVILLDEPGVSLHASAQGDLLRFIDRKLSENYQIVYTTHSPFMIEATELERVRTVEDVVAKEDLDSFDFDLEAEYLSGTKVSDETLSTNRETLFPLQAALGYSITQSLFVGKNTLLVEGPSDILYINIFSRLLEVRKRTHLNPAWTLSPTGGVDKLSSFVSLFHGNHLNCVALCDYKHGDKSKIEKVLTKGLLEDSRLFRITDFIADKKSGDIEDMLGEDFYVKLVCDCYGVKSTGKDSLPKCPDDKLSHRVLDHVEEMFRTHADWPEFGHFPPSQYLLMNTSKYVDADIEVALNRFEALFSAVNPLLKIGDDE